VSAYVFLSSRRITKRGMGSAASSRRKGFYRAKLEEYRDNLVTDIDDEMLQMFGIEEIMSITERGPEYMTMFAELEVTARIVESMMRWRANELVIRAATKMFTLSLWNEACAEQLRILNGRELLEQCLIIHKFDNFVTEDGSVALQLLFDTCNTVGLKQIDAAFHAKDPLRICEVMRAHPRKPMVQEIGIVSIGHLTHADKSIVDVIKTDVEQAISTMTYAMDKNFAHQKTILFAVNICFDFAVDPEGRAYAGKCGFVPRVMNALVEFSGWGEREHRKDLEEEVKRKALERAKNAGKKELKKIKITKEEVAEKPPRTAPFITDLHICQICIYTLGKLIDGNPRNLGHVEELGMWKLLTYLIHRFDELEYKPPLVIPLVLKRGYVDHQKTMKEKLEMERAGIIAKRSAFEQEKHEDTLIRRRQEYKPCIYATTIGRGSCYRHCVECFAVDGICDQHLDRQDHLADI
jgi:hypothetical protein